VLGVAAFDGAEEP
jgi:hypothetical protein